MPDPVSQENINQPTSTTTQPVGTAEITSALTKSGSLTGSYRLGVSKEVDNVTAELTEEVLEFEGAASPDSGSSDTTKPTVTALLFQPDAEPREFKLTELKSLVTADQNFIWLDLSDYSPDLLRSVAKILGLHPVSLRAALSPWQRPRFDNFSNHSFITVTVAHLNSEAYRVLAGELDLFYGNNYLLSVHKSPLPFARHLVERARQSPELVQLDAAFMLYLVLDELLEYYEELSDHIEVETEKMEQRALKEISDSFLTDLLQLKRYIFALNRLADQHRRVFATLLRPDNPLVTNEKTAPYFHDLEAHFERLLDTLQPAKEAVNGAFDIYVSHVSHRTNQVIKTLTIVSTILLPATVIISIFGTNIASLPQSGLLEFGLMIVSIMVVIGFILFIFHRRGWI